jgi:hypothetical protein
VFDSRSAMIPSSCRCQCRLNAEIERPDELEKEAVRRVKSRGASTVEWQRSYVFLLAISNQHAVINAWVKI